MKLHDWNFLQGRLLNCSFSYFSSYTIEALLLLESECYNLVTGVGKKKDFIERMQTKRAPELSCLRKEFRGGQKKPAAVIAFFKQDIGKSP